MTHTLRALLQPNRSSCCSTGSSRRSVITKSKSRSSSTESADSISCSFDPLDLSHVSLRSCVSEFSLDEGATVNTDEATSSDSMINSYGNRKRIFDLDKTTFTEMNECSFSEEDATGSESVSLPQPRLVEITVDEFNDTADTTQCVDDHEMFHLRTEHSRRFPSQRESNDQLPELNYDEVAFESKDAGIRPGSPVSTESETNAQDCLNVPIPADVIPSQENMKQVRFGQLEIHEHVVALGGAVPSSGPSLTLEPEAQSYYAVPVEEYEKYRPGTSRKGKELLRSSLQRIEILQNLGYTMREINEDSRVSEEIRKGRIKSFRKSFLWRTLGLRKSFLWIKNLNSY